MQKIESIYSKNVVVSPKKKILVYLFDYLLCLVLTFVLYTCINFVNGFFPYVTSIQEDSINIQQDLYETVEDSYLSYVDKSTGLLVDREVQIERILKNNVLYVLNSYGDEYLSRINSVIYNGFNSLDLTSLKEGDGLYTYFVTFKTNNIDDFNDKNNYGSEYYLNNILNINENEYFEIGKYQNDPNYPLLKLEYALALDEHFHNESYRVETYDEIYNFYYEGLRNGINDVVSTYIPYVNLYSRFSENTNSMLNIRGNIILISFLISLIITYFLFPLIYKNSKTLGMKLFKQGACKIDGSKTTILNDVIRLIIQLFSSFSLQIPVIFFLFGSQAMYFFDVNLLGFINIYILGLVSFCLAVFSFIFTFINKDTHQNVEEFLAQIVIKDINEFNVIEEKKETENNEIKYEIKSSN